MNGEHPSIAILEQLADTLRSKANDYAANAWDDNFTGTALLVGIDAEQVFHTLIGVKVMRLQSLLAVPGKVALNEPIDDTLLDLANYAILWRTYRQQFQTQAITSRARAEYSQAFDDVSPGGTD